VWQKHLEAAAGRTVEGGREERREGRTVLAGIKGVLLVVGVGRIPVRHHHLSERQPVEDGTHEAACRLRGGGEGGREGGRERRRVRGVLGSGWGQRRISLSLALPPYLERVIEADHLQHQALPEGRKGGREGGEEGGREERTVSTCIPHPSFLTSEGKASKEGGREGREGRTERNTSCAVKPRRRLQFCQ